MPTYPLGTKAYRRNDAFVPEVVCRNFYVEKDASGISPDGVMRVQRPGLTPLYMLGGPIRGMSYRTVSNERLAVAGTALYAGQTSKGSIPGTGGVAIANTTFATAIVAGNALYLYDGTNVTAVDIPDDPFTDEPQFAQDVDQLNQYILVLLTNGRFYWIVPGETEIDVLNFATAESAPDGGVALRRISDEFWIFGTETIEVWQSTGDLDAPFQRVPGRYYERGCLDRDSVRRFDNSVMWVADDCQVYRGSAVPQVVSDNAIAERVRLRSASTSAWTFGVDGHKFYALSIPGQGTFAFDASTQEWCEFASLGQDMWRAGFGYEEAGTVVAGDRSSGKVWRLDAENGTDDGAVIERVLTGTASLMGRTGRNDSLSVGVGSSADCTVRIRWKDGQANFPDYYDEIDIRAPLDVATIRRLGIPLQPYRTVEISCVDEARIRVAGCTANESFAR